MEIIEQRLGGVVVLKLSGWLDSRGCQALAAQSVGALDQGACVLLLDVEGLGYLTSESFRTLLFIRQQAIQAQATLALYGLSGSALELFRISGLRECFKLFGSQEHALAELQMKQAIGQHQPVSSSSRIAG